MSSTAPDEELQSQAGPSRARPGGRDLGPNPAAHSRDVLTRRSLFFGDLTTTALIGLALPIAMGMIIFKPISMLALLPVPIMAKFLGLYDNDDTKLRHSTLDEAPRLLGLAAFTVVCFQFFDVNGTGGLEGHLAKVGFVLAITLGLIIGRGVTRRLVTAALPPERCVAIGSESATGELALRFERSHSFKARIVAEVESLPGLQGSAFEERERLSELVRSSNAERIIVTPRGTEDLELARAANSLGIKVSIVPRLLDTIGTSYSLDDLIGLTMLGMRRPRITGSSAVVKRTFDLVLGSLIALLAAPLMILIAIAIKLDSPGPVIYRQRRIGRSEHEFTMLKFRSMDDGSHRKRSHLATLNESEGLFKITDDPRITRVGRIIRKTNLDELPQIFNVLRGEMSLVGPRPLVPEEDMLLSGWARFRYRVLPGMTGPWQLGSAARFSIEDMASLDYVYVTTWSLWGDIKVLMRTAVYVVGLHGR
ncbi:MAG: exopolysaccharide biosynthesis polyprenyl glycosylphosphotransferase [Actinomycetes bacterium]